MLSGDLVIGELRQRIELSRVLIPQLIMVNFVVLLLASVLSTLVSAKDFGYLGQHGPQHWSEEYKSCSGKLQSPVMIDKQLVVPENFSDIEYMNFDAPPQQTLLTNNGHTVLVTMSFHKGKEPRMKGGPLENNGEYQFEQFHFHWGENDTVGSEDMIDNHRYLAEMHVVMRNVKYKDLASALGQEFGVAVLAFFFQKNSTNKAYGEFVEALGSIEQKNKSYKLLHALPLMEFLSEDSIRYYSYIGSLTTPPCTEKVIWIDYQEPIDLSEYQIERFRQLTISDEHLKNNFRPVQPLNNRTIYENIPRQPVINNGWISLLTFDDFTQTDGSMSNQLDCGLVVLLLGQVFVAFN